MDEPSRFLHFAWHDSMLSMLGAGSCSVTTSAIGIENALC